MFLPRSAGAILLGRARKQLHDWRELVRLRMAFLLTGMGRCCAGSARAAASCIVPRRLSPDDVEPVVLDLPIEQLQPGFGHHLRAPCRNCLPIRPAPCSRFG